MVKSPRVRRLSIVGLTMIIVIIPFILYYLFFVQSQTAYFTNRNFRVLAHIGSQIKSKVDDLSINLINAAKKAREKKSDDKGIQPTNTAAEADRLRRAIELIPNMQSVKMNPTQQTAGGARPGASAAGAISARPAQEAAPPSAAANANKESHANANTQTSRPRRAPPGRRYETPEVSLSVQPDQGSYWLYFQYGGGTAAGSSGIGGKSEINKLFDPFVARFVIDELDQTEQRLFDEVLVAEQETGIVIFEDGPSNLTIVSLDTLENGEGEKLGLKLADQSSSLTDVVLGGDNYKLFLQPVRLTLDSSEDDKDQGVRWVVCGLTRSDHLRDETYAVSYTVLIIFVFAVLLSALSWPLLKLKLMGPKDRLRRADLALTFVCAMMGTALLTFLLLDQGMYIALEKVLDDQLKELSAGIRKNFRDEIGSALAQLNSLNNAILALANKESPDFNWNTEAAKPASALGAKTGSAPTSWFPKKVDLLVDTIDWKTAQYPYFNSVTWADSADPKGLQRIKWTTAPDTTAFIEVSSRPYFTNVRDGNLWKLTDRDGGFDYFLELVNSKNTGENVAVVSTRAPVTSWVSSMDTRLLSLMGVVLPTGYGYAVIDGGGSVLFHSVEVNNLNEQFFQECDNDRLLRAAVSARTNELINANYLGKGHRLFVSPIDNTPWVLVVFRDKQMARTINLELLTQSLIFYLVFTLAALAVVSVIYLPGRGARIRWLWPEERRATQYKLLTAVNAVVAAVFFIVLKVGGESAVVICCFVLPLLAVVIGAVILNKRPTAGQGDSGIFGWSAIFSYRTGYTIALAGYLALLSILPTLGFFRVARDFELNLSVKHGQVSIARALERQAQRVATQYASVKIGNQNKRKDKRAFLEARLEHPSGQSTWDVYDSFFFKTSRTALDGDWSAVARDRLNNVDWALMQLRPLYNQSCVESQELSRGASADGLWRWGKDQDGQIRLRKDHDGRGGDISVALASNSPDVSHIPVARLLWFAALVILLALVYVLVRFVARHFFLLDQGSPRATFAIAPSLSLSSNTVLLQPPMAVNGAVWDSKHFHTIDLSKIDSLQDWTIARKSGETTQLPIVLDHFEHRMGEPAVNWQKLQTIEQFLSVGGRVIIVSTVDPLRFSLTSEGYTSYGSQDDLGSDTSDKSNGPAENNFAAINQPAAGPGQREVSAQTRWWSVLSTFVTVYARDNASAEFIGNNRELLKILKTSQPWRYLETIGKEVIANPPLRADNAHNRAATEEQINRVVDQARAYHQALWATCSQDERCALIHLALDGMITSKNKDLRQLMKRGLVVRDPAVRLMDESFRRFVISASMDEDIDAWRRAGGSTWQLIKTPLLLVLLGVALFLFLTQKELYDSTISFVSAVTAGIAILFRLVGMFQKGDGGAAPQG
jgi:hypothetical protein